MNITTVIVSYNRADLLKRAYESIRAFSDRPVIIIDGSTADNPCDQYAQSLQSRDTKVIATAKNIGHGKGMDMGIREADTDFILLMDSDAEIKDPAIIQKMYNAMANKCFGIGQVVYVDEGGNNVAENHPEAIPYLHPHFAMISRDKYNKVPGFVHHGAPCLRTMQYLHTFKKYGIIDVPVCDYVYHEGRGTRSLNPPEFLQNWK